MNQLALEYAGHSVAIFNLLNIQFNPIFDPDIQFNPIPHIWFNPDIWFNPILHVQIFNLFYLNSILHIQIQSFIFKFNLSYSNSIFFHSNFLKFRALDSLKPAQKSKINQIKAKFKGEIFNFGKKIPPKNYWVGAKHPQSPGSYSTACSDKPFAGSIFLTNSLKDGFRKRFKEYTEFNNYYTTLIHASCKDSLYPYNIARKSNFQTV